MIFIEYIVGCRNCMQGDGVTYSLFNMDADVEEYKNKTEFEVMTLVEHSRQKDDYTCMMCGSSNVEVMDVKVDDYILYDYNYLVERCKANSEYLITLLIDKKDSDINLIRSGSITIEVNFLQAAIQKILNSINHRPPSQYESKIKGRFFVVLSGKHDFIKDKTIVRLERFRSVGMTEDEILNGIKLFAERLGITI